MVGRRSSFTALLLACMLTACGKKPQNNEAQAPLLIGESFVISPDGGKDTLIGIKKEALQKEFLLQGEIIQQPVVPTFKALKSRIVIFVEKNKKLNMLESIDGHSSSSSLPQNILPAQFKIVKQENDVLYFDFAQGMSKIYMTKDWYASDTSGRQYDPEKMWKIAELTSNFVDKVETDASNNLIIRQIAQLSQSKKISKDEDGETNFEALQTPLEIKYYLSPYIKNEGFVSKVSPGMTKVGFFEVNPRLQAGGGSVVYASKWDHRKPIVYSISENTPPEYVQAIKEGVLYWNKAFGKEIVKVDMAPKGVMAPSFQYNVIQWVDWKDAGYAYADAQMDPRTGEILHASVYLTSVFAFSATAKAKQILRRLTFDQSKPKTNAKQFALAGFEQDLLCNHDTGSDLSIILAKMINDVESGRAKEEVLLKLSQDTLRETVAHEVGHTLGLRHNFAGSLATTIPNDKRDEVFSEYLSTGMAPSNMVSSSTVMDYQLFQDALLTGDHIVRDQNPYEYDMKAIQDLYFDLPSKTMPLFCTDTHIGKYMDCATFDFGPSVFDFIRYSEKKAFENLPYTLMEKFISNKANGLYSGFQIIRSLPSLTSFALEAMKPRITFLKSLTESAQFLNAEKGLSGDDNTSYLIKEVQKNGGLNSFLNHNPVLNPLDLIKRFQDLLDSDVYSSGETAAGPFSFTTVEKVAMASSVKSFINSLRVGILYSELAIYTLPYRFRQEAFGPELAQNFFEIASDVLGKNMGTFTEDMVLADGVKVTLDVPKFFYSDWTRTKAAGLLTNRSEDAVWGYRQKGELRRYFKNLIETSLKNNDISKVNLDHSSDEFTKWVLTNRKILDSLN